MKQNKIIQEISLLYELSLAIGHSLDFQENCERFFKLLVQRKNLNMAALWINNSFLNKGNEKGFELYFIYPSIKRKVSNIPEDHRIAKVLNKKRFHSVLANDPDYKNFILEDNPSEGPIVIYRLQDIGFIKFQKNENIGLDDYHLNQLSKIFQKFGILLAGSISQERFDIQSKKLTKTQSKLDVAEEKYRDIVNSISEGIVITDLEGKIKFINKYMAQLTGYSLSEVRGKIADRIFIHKDSQKKIISKTKDRIINPAETYKVLHLRKGGTPWLGRVNASLLKNAEGENVGTLGLVMDVTQIEKAQIQIKESEYQLREIFNTLIDAVIILDRMGQIKRWNHQAELLFGFIAAEVLNKKINNLIIPKKFQGLFNFENYKPDGKDRNEIFHKRIELIGQNKYGETFPIEMSITPLHLGYEILFSVFIRNISLQKESEKLLIEAKHAAEHAKNVEQQFLMNVSHEIRTPINSLIGMSSLMKETDLNDQQKDFLNAVEISALNLKELIENILDISKMDSKEINLELRMFSFRKLIKNLKKSVQLKIVDSSVEFQTFVDPRISTLAIGDPNRINQILKYFLRNSIKYTQKGFIRLDIILLKRSKENLLIEFKISDSGIGVNREELNILFTKSRESFYNQNLKFSDSRIAAYIVKQLVDLMDGTIKINKSPATKSSIKFLIPLKDSGIPDTIQGMVETSQKTENEFGTLQILVSENNPIDRKILVNSFEKWQCNYVVTTNGNDALIELQKNKFDIILLAIHLPLKDGFTIAQHVRSGKFKGNNKVPIIAFTNSPSLEEKSAAISVGINEYIERPIDPQKLRTCIIKWIDRDNLIKYKKGVTADFNNLKRISNGNKKFIKDILETFIQETPITLAQIQQAINTKDKKRIQILAHKMTSSFELLNLNKIQKWTSELAKKSAKKDTVFEEIADTFKEIEIEFEIVSPQVQNQIQTLSQPN